MPVSLDRRLARLEAMRDGAPVGGGISGVLIAWTRLEADRRARGLSDEELEAEMSALPKPQWYVDIQAAIARDREDRQA